MLSLVLTFTLVSCGDENGNGNGQNGEEQDGEPKYVSVTKDEWVNAIELNGITSLTVDCELDGCDEGVLIEEIKFCNGLGYMSAELNGEPTQTYYVKMEEQLSFKHIFSTGDPYVFIYVTNKYPDYAYEQFEYDEDGGYYEITHIDENEGHPVTYNIRVYFGENKFISKIDISSECDGQTGAYSFLFSKYNSTDSFSIPSDEVYSFISESFPVSLDYIEISDSSLNGIYGEKACNELNSFIESMDLSNVISYYTRNDGPDDEVKGADFEIQSGILTFAENEVSFDGISINVSRLGEDSYYDIDLWEKDSYGDKIRVCHIFFID